MTVTDTIDHDDMWLRRAAIMCQVGAREQTDENRLFRYCERRAHEHREELSGLSYREATKHIDHLVAS